MCRRTLGRDRHGSIRRGRVPHKRHRPLPVQSALPRRRIRSSVFQRGSPKGGGDAAAAASSGSTRPTTKPPGRTRNPRFDICGRRRHCLGFRHGSRAPYDQPNLASLGDLPEYADGSAPVFDRSGRRPGSLTQSTATLVRIGYGEHAGRPTCNVWPAPPAQVSANNDERTWISRERFLTMPGS